MIASEPLVTVAMPVYNAMPYLPQAVESILGQTYKDFKFLIVNDGSTDGSADYLNSLTDPRVEVIHQQNQGLGATLNRTLDLCRTPYYARIDADDVALPDRLDKQLTLMQSRLDLILAGSRVQFLVEDKVLAAPPVPTDHKVIRALLLTGSAAFCHPSLMFRTEVARSVRYRIGGAGEDFDFFLRICDAGPVTNHPDVLLHYRMHRSSLAITHYNEVLLGMAYAFECATCRSEGRTEPEFEPFAETWHNRPRMRRLKDAVHRTAAMQYRRSILDRANGHMLRGTLRLGFAGLAQPHRVVRRLTGSRNR